MSTARFYKGFSLLYTEPTRLSSGAPAAGNLTFLGVSQIKIPVKKVGNTRMISMIQNGAMD